MIRILIFCTLLACVSGYAIRRGGAPERAVAIILLAGAVATWAVAIGIHGGTAGHFITVEHGILFVDCVMLAALMGVSLAADRFWPLWMTALHAFGVVGHLAKAIAPEIMTNVYLAAHLFSAYPGLILLTLATHWHRSRMRRTGHDPSWSISWRWSIRRGGGWADRLIAAFGGLAPALAAAPARLLPLVGNDARAVALIVVHRRVALATLRERAVRRPIVATRYDLLRYLHQQMAFDGEEALRVLFVNVRRELIAEEVLAHGGPATIEVEPRAVIVRALALAAAGVVLVHNHPGGDPTPSVADRRFTRRLTVAAECLGIAVHDHLIVARDGEHRIDVAAVD